MQGLKGLTIAAVAFVVLAAVSLIGIAIIDTTDDVTKSIVGVDNESISMANASISASANDEWVASSWTFYNNTAQTEVCAATDYVVYADIGQIYQANNASCPSLSWYIDYQYYADTPVSTAAGLFRSGLILFATFSALIALVLVGTIVIKLVKGNE